MSPSDRFKVTEAAVPAAMNEPGAEAKRSPLIGILLAGVKLAVLAALAAGIWFFLTPYFRKDRNTEGDKFRAFPQNTVDVIALGSSHIQYAFNPGYFYAESGYYSYVFGSVCQPFSESVYLLEEVLKTQHPETVIVDVFTLLPQSQVCYADGTYYIAMDLMSGRTRIDAAEGIPDSVDDETRLGYQYDLYMNHDNWKTMDFSDLETVRKNASPDQGIAWGLGYVDQKPEKLQFTPLEVFAPQKEVPLSDDEKYWIDRLADLCKANDIHLIFVKTPYQEDQADADKLASIWKYLDEKGYEYIDFLEKASELDWFLDMDGDTWHNNTWGAEIVTRYLAGYIQERGYVADHSDNADAEQVYETARRRASEYLLTKQNVNIYRLMEDGAKYPCTVFFRYKGAEKSSIGAYENEALNALGLNHDFIKDKEKDYYAAVKDGVLLQESSRPFEIELEGNVISLKEDDILFNGASTGLTGELQIIFCDDAFEWINAVPIDYASGHFWKKSCDGWNCTWNP